MWWGGVSTTGKLLGFDSRTHSFPPRFRFIQTTLSIHFITMQPPVLSYNCPHYTGTLITHHCTGVSSGSPSQAQEVLARDFEASLLGTFGLISLQVLSVDGNRAPSSRAVFNRTAHLPQVDIPLGFIHHQKEPLRVVFHSLSPKTHHLKSGPGHHAVSLKSSYTEGTEVSPSPKLQTPWLD